MWDERYADDEFAYGTEPNDFLAEHSGMLSGPVLSLAEGEGRNAVFLASLGLEVVGVDGSAVGLAKAQKLAALKGVSIQTTVVDLETYTPPANFFGAAVSISAHLPSQARKRLHRLVAQSIKPGGLIMLEGYSQAQINRNTGGPKDPDMLLTRADMEQEFPGFEVLLSREVEREVIEGKFHTGLASVVQFIGKRKEK
ncbi:cyclopropane-fatty-acyl-phospholipid synthase family protein [Halopseudomonas bauzanensis]|uniref:SAM-dependent methyltransferase n=1 Tax=Halopseudomonas bauzanensis TaxID=653930 RepID=UPI00352669B1